MALPMEYYHLRVEFAEPVLGSQPEKQVAQTYLLNKAREKNPGLDTSDEEETLEEALEKGTTVFHKLDGRPIFFDYQCRGFLKEAAATFNGHMGVKNMRAKMAAQVFVHPRRLLLHLPDGGQIDYLERPLRCMTMQGPRTSLARSEMLPAGTWFECYLRCYKSEFSEALLQDLLSYGRDQGIGQWRSGGYGAFRFSLTKLDGPPDGAENW